MTETKEVDKIQDFIDNKTCITIDSRVLKVKDYFVKEDFILIEDNPFVKLDSLSRVFRKVFDRIISYTTNIEQCPNKQNDYCAVVKSEYQVEHAGKSYICTGLADCNSKNAPRGNSGKYSTCLAESRSNARVLRNMIGIPVCSYEEVEASNIDDVIKTDIPIEPSQKMLIERKFINERKKSIDDIGNILGKTVNALEELTKAEAAIVISAINKEKTK